MAGRYDNWTDTALNNECKKRKLTQFAKFTRPDMITGLVDSDYQKQIKKLEYVASKDRLLQRDGRKARAGLELNLKRTESSCLEKLKILEKRFEGYELASMESLSTKNGRVDTMNPEHSSTLSATSIQADEPVPTIERDSSNGAAGIVGNDATGLESSTISAEEVGDAKKEKGLFLTPDPESIRYSRELHAQYLKDESAEDKNAEESADEIVGVKTTGKRKMDEREL
ncbi:hypothetical protein IFR05_013423 [Cadophora sp. M221]|nr:hypothetical protein IFR05_013423 [Cadophora sp. M221]